MRNKEIVLLCGGAGDGEREGEREGEGGEGREEGQRFAANPLQPD